MWRVFPVAAGEIDRWVAHRAGDDDRAVAGTAGTRRVVLAVDDAHVLDGHSATLIHRLVRVRAAGAVITVRSGEQAPAPVVSLWTEGLADALCDWSTVRSHALTT